MSPRVSLLCLLMLLAVVTSACERRSDASTPESAHGAAPSAPPEAPAMRGAAAPLTRAQPASPAVGTPPVSPPAVGASPASPASPTVAPPVVGGLGARMAPQSFAPLVERVNPSVVNIYTKVVVHERVRTLDPFFPFAPRERLSESLGTGFIIDAKGLILTNNHVIDGAVDIRVRLVDGREFHAEVVGSDPPTDLAVIQLQEAPEMVPAALGDSDKARVGDWVVAIGNALGLSSTVTVGIISGKGRSELPLGGRIRFMDFIQTDASINPGNSGGPLLNMDGEVIGINTLINREGQGIGFAIPINMAQGIVEPLIREGKVSRAWLGIYVAVVDARIAAEAGLPGPTGAMVARVIPNGPAEAAGIEKGDIILEFDGQVVKDTNDLRLKSSLAGVGRSVPLKVRRGGQDRQVTMVMARSPHE